jgi:glutamyl endopeptidase
MHRIFACLRSLSSSLHTTLSLFLVAVTLLAVTPQMSRSQDTTPTVPPSTDPISTASPVVPRPSDVPNPPVPPTIPVGTDPNSMVTDAGVILPAPPKIDVPTPIASPSLPIQPNELTKNPNDVSVNAIIGTDDRQPITDSTADPARKVVRVEFKVPAGWRTWCTGFLYDDNTIATAGHCIYNRDPGLGPNDWMTEVTVTPGENSGNINGNPPNPKPYTTCNAKEKQTPAGWILNGDYNYDYATVKLDCTIGNGVGIFTLRQPSDSELSTNFPSVNIGYPQEKGSKSQYFSNSKVVNYSYAAVGYTNDTTPGHSGGPIYNYPQIAQARVCMPYILVQTYFLLTGGYA